MISEKKPDLVMVDATLSKQRGIDYLRTLAQADFESIFLAHSSNHALEAFQYRAVGFLLKPIQLEALLLTLRNVQKRVQEKEKNRTNERLIQQFSSQMGASGLIGIPTMEGFEFIPIEDIIRCEGLQKCTRVVTENRSDIVSSYNLGEFVKLLEQYGFFSCHRSFLVNLNKILRYHREGTITMTDHSVVPVSRRKKCEFLDRVMHI
jgi:two-component system LytT family response regulator